MTAAQCARCAKPMPHDQAVVCASCGSHLRGLLARTAKLSGEHAVTISLMDNLASTGTSTKADDLGWWRNPEALEPVPLPLNLDAAIAYGAAMSELSTWARHCCETRGIFYVPGAEPLETFCAFLGGQADWLRHQPEADEAFRGIENACKQLERIVDRRPDCWYAGPCTTPGCGTDLYPLAGAETAVCVACGASYGTAERKAWLLREAQEVWGNAAWLSSTLTILGVRCTDAMVRGYAHRGRLAPHPEPDGRGHPRYRLGSVLEIVVGAMQDRAKVGV